MKLTKFKDGVILENIKEFDLEHIFECGQTFRWNKEIDESYTGVAYKKVLNISKKGETIVFKNTDIDDFKNIWWDYFDLDTDYKKIKDTLKSVDDIMTKATDYGHGIRILNQEPWEMLISFIISANNNIPRIKKSIERLSMNFGDKIGTYNGKEYFAFPTPEQIAELDVNDIRACGVGYRDQYILETAKMILEKEVLLRGIHNLEMKDARKEIIKFKGVGEKVADCILLFAYKKNQAFPIDTWVKKVMERFYVEENSSTKEIRAFAEDKFLNLEGYAQQYLFFYVRSL